MMAKEKSSVSRAKLLNSPVFERSRENVQEFVHANACSSLLLNSIRSFRQSASDNRVHSRLVKQIKQVLQEDLISRRGERNATHGMKREEGKKILRHFTFNIHTPLHTILLCPYEVDTQTGSTTLRDLRPMIDLSFPSGATHVCITSVFAGIDFKQGKASVEYSDTLRLSLTDTAYTNTTLTPHRAPVLNSETTALYFLKMEFYQEVNGVQYSLLNGKYNCLELIEVV